MEATQQAKEATASDLGWLLDESDDAVVTLVAGETRLVAHRAVLTDRSPIFEAMFRHHMLEACSGSVNIPDVEGPVLRQLLAYLYNLQAPQVPGTAHKLLAAADKYGLCSLREDCERQLVAQLSVETAAAAAVLAIRHGCDGLRTAAIHFIKSHLVEVMATQGYADAVRTQPEDVVEMGRLLSETSSPAPVDSGTSAAATAAPVDSGTSATATATAAPRPLGDHRGGETPASAASPTAAAHNGSPPDEAADSRVGRPAAVDRGPSPSAAPASVAPPTAATHQGSPPDEDADSRVGRPAAVDRGPSPTSPSAAPASAAPPTAAAHHGSPPDEAADSRLRQLSAVEKNRRLVEAAKRGTVGELEALLAAGADVGASGGFYKGTALHWAAEKGHEEAVRLLLAAGADHGARGRFYWGTALHLAAEKGHEEVARRLLAAGAAVDERDDEQWTPLHEAAAKGHAAVVRLLLAAGADHGARDAIGSTPLHWAAYKGHTEAAAALLAGGADRAARDIGGRTPLDDAVRSNQRQMVELLRQER